MYLYNVTLCCITYSGNVVNYHAIHGQWQYFTSFHTSIALKNRILVLDDVAIDSKCLDNEIDYFGSVAVDYDQKPQQKCCSSDSLNDGRDPATERRDFLRAESWPPGGDVNGEKPEPVKDAGSLINRSISHEPNPKNSKERKTSTGKRFTISVFKTKRRKKSPNSSRNEENYVEFESTFESSHLRGLASRHLRCLRLKEHYVFI